MVAWKININPNELLKIIEASKIIGKDNSIKFSVFEFKVYENLLFSMLTLSDDIPEIDKRNILWKSLLTSGKKGRITKNSLLLELSILEKNYLTQPLSRYVLTTSISIDKSIKINRQYFGKTQIIFEGSMPNKFIRNINKIKNEAQKSSFTPQPSDYLSVRIHVDAKSVAAAANFALDSIDLLRGIWNLYENSKYTFRISFIGQPKPVNSYILGPFHFLHYPTGKLASKTMWWYENSFIAPITPKKIIDFDKIYNIQEELLYQINKSTYKNDLIKAIIRYTRALDDRNWENAFLKLWGLLEFLTDTINGTQKETIRKAAFIYKDFSFKLQTLEQLREYRNHYVHSNIENQEIESFLYQLKSVVEQLIFFHLNNPYNFKSMEEVGLFLNHPRDINALNSKIKMAKNVKKFLTLSK